MKEVTACLLAYNRHHLQGGDEYQWEGLELARNYPNGYLVAVLLAQGVKAETFWRIPRVWREEYKMDLSDCPILNAQIWEKYLREVGYRFPRKGAKFICEAMLKLRMYYDENAENIWNNGVTVSQIYDRLIEFNGIGQKKASMAINILHREGVLEFEDKRDIDISYDKHVRQIFMRSGLAEKDEIDHIIEIAREENPEYPGELDKPCWYIGKDYCFNDNPLCSICPLSIICEKKIDYIAR